MGEVFVVLHDHLRHFPLAQIRAVDGMEQKAARQVSISGEIIQYRSPVVEKTFFQTVFAVLKLNYIAQGLLSLQMIGPYIF